MIEISTVEELQDMNLDLTEDYVLANDIDASDTINWNSGAGFDPIGSSSTPFTGTFDGAGFTISGLFINRPSTARVGLFGAIGAGSVTDLNMTAVDITGGAPTGGLSGDVRDTTSIARITVAGDVSGSGTNVGGVIGNAFRNTAYEDITSEVNVEQRSTNDNTGGVAGNGGEAGNIWIRCISKGTITGGRDRIGGLFGSLKGSTASQCYARTPTIAGRRQCGGLIGLVSGNSSVSDCYAFGDASGTLNLAGSTGTGGLIGTVQNTASVSRCYSIGSASAPSDVGGLIGANTGTGAVTDCFWDTETSGNATSPGGGTGKATADMTDVATFTDTATTGLTTAWDFESNPNDDAGNDDIWGIHATFNDGYPYLTALETPPAATGSGPRIGRSHPIGIGPFGPAIG